MECWGAAADDDDDAGVLAKQFRLHCTAQWHWQHTSNINPTTTCSSLGQVTRFMKPSPTQLLT